MKNIILLLLMFLSFSSFSQDKDAEYYMKYVQDSLWTNTTSEEKDWRLIIQYIDKAISLDSLQPTYYWNRGKANYFNTFYLRSIKDFNDVLAIDSISELASKTHYQKANIYNYLTKYDQALISINKAIKIDSAYSSFVAGGNFDLKASIYFESGDFDNAIINWKIAKNLEPDNFEYYNKNIDRSESFKKTPDFRRTNLFYPYTKLSVTDSLKYPIKVGIEFNLISLNVAKLEDNFFEAEIQAGLYSKYSPKFVSYDLDDLAMKNDTIDITDFSKKIGIKTIDSIVYVENAKLSYEYGNYTNAINGKFRYDHNWDLSDFPFDKQKLRITFNTTVDSSVYKFEKYQKYGFDGHFNNVTGLPTGLDVDEVNFYNEFETSPYQDVFSPGNKRYIVTPKAVFEIILSRSGSLLFIKLFLGTFLAFIMSLSAFTISKRNFPSRIDVSVGALFIAVGNKYFVESTTPMVQILTKADIINNISLLLIIMNVVFIISQHRKDINIGKFEDSKYTLKFSAALLAALVFITIIF